MALTQTYCDFATGNDYKGASFTDGAYTSATKTLVKTNAFTASKVNHWLWLESNDGGSIVAGYYRIATWTDASTVILATDAGAGVDDDAAKCTQHDGTTTKPWRSVQGALDLTTRDSTNGDQINVKAGTAQVLAASVSAATYGTPTTAAPLVLRGYTSSADDGGIGDIDGAATYSIFAATTYDYVHLIDLKLHNCGANKIVVLRFACLIENCEIYGNTGVNYAVTVQNASTVTRCSIYGTQYGISVVTAAALYNHINDTNNNMALAIQATTHCVCIGNVIRLAAAAAIGIQNATGGGWFIGNDIVNSAAGTAAGVRLGVYAATIMNNIIQGFSGAGGEAIDVASQALLLLAGNAYYNNTATETAGTKVILSTNNDTLGASPFVNAANGDFDINGTVSGVTEDGWPSAFLGLASTTPKMDKGAVQAGAGSGGGVIRRVMRLLGG